MDKQNLNQSRANLSAVLQIAGKLVTIDDAFQAIDLNRQEATKTLSRWTHQGWLTRVAPGLYAPIPLDAHTSAQVIEDPWVMIPYLFEPCYVGGWTAAGHWDFTEQIFRSIFVFTAQPVRKKMQVFHDTEFTLKHLPRDSMFGLKTLWRDNEKVMISDKHRTIIDMLDTPDTGGGITHVFECLEAYFKDPDTDSATLIEYAKKLENGAIFKRLGFLAEKIGRNELIEPCQSHLTTGNAKLDSSIKSPRLVKKWNLWIPENWSERKVKHD